MTRSSERSNRSVEEMMNSNEREEEINSNINQRISRSPLRFARFRQTRVSSLSPTPTLVGRGRNRSRDQSQSRNCDFASSAGVHSNAEMKGNRARSKSRLRDGSRDTGTLSNVQENAQNRSNGKQNGQIPNKQDQEQPKPSDPSSSSKPKKPLYARLLPHPIPHFLGYRKPIDQIHPRHRDVKPYPSIIPIIHKIPLALESVIWSFFGAFVGIAIVILVFSRPKHFTSSSNIPPHPWASPSIIGSFGASSVLIYAVPASPLSQPRCFVGGQFLSALVGVCITKLFALAGSPTFNIMLTDRSTSIVWIAGALATALSITIMSITGTIHPPGGATAVLCATNPEVSRLGWKVLPVVLLSSVLMLVWNLIWMNLGRRKYPNQWMVPAPASTQDGYLLKFVFDYISNKYQKKQKPIKDEEKGTINPTQSTSQTSRESPSQTTSQPPINQSSNPWQDEGKWEDVATEEKKSKFNRTADQEESSERVERPT